MSNFFSNINQYVTNSVANLNLNSLSPRRFFAREESTSSTNGNNSPHHPHQYLGPHLSVDSAGAAGGHHHPPHFHQYHHAGPSARGTPPGQPPIFPHFSNSPTRTRAGSGSSGKSTPGGIEPKLPPYVTAFQRPTRSQSLAGNENPFFGASGGVQAAPAHPRVTAAQQQRAKQQQMRSSTHPALGDANKGPGKSLSSGEDGESSQSTAFGRRFVGHFHDGARRMSQAEFHQGNDTLPDLDGSFFEQFTELAKFRGASKRGRDHGPVIRGSPTEQGVGIRPREICISAKEMELLYVEVLYTICHKIGTHGSEYSHHIEDLFAYAKTAFGVSSESHREFLDRAKDVKPPIIVLNVVVVEAENLEAKDPNGFSDPYCMLGIIPGDMMDSPSTSEIASTFDDVMGLMGAAAAMASLASPGAPQIYHPSQQQSQQYHALSGLVSPFGDRPPPIPRFMSPVSSPSGGTMESTMTPGNSCSKLATSALGFSDPYCMLGIQPSVQVTSSTATAGANNNNTGATIGSGSLGYGSGPGSPSTHATPPMSPRVQLTFRSSASGSDTYPSESDDGGIDSASPTVFSRSDSSPLERASSGKKHYSFRRSFRRSDRSTASGSPSSGSAESSKTSTVGGFSIMRGSSAKDVREQQREQISQQQQLLQQQQLTGFSNAVPAKFIRATSVRPRTLCPKWNEKFRFDIDDPQTDNLHLDIWDHDDETSVLEAVSNLNKVKSVKGLGRFFKEIAQSTRSGSADDFLGCVNVPLRNIPSSGTDKWLQLVGRSTRSNVQGQIRLKLWLSHRENQGISEEEGLSDEVAEHAHLIRIFASHELRLHHGNSRSWKGDMSKEALTILHQHKIQGEISSLQNAIAHWIAFSRLHQEPGKSLDYKLLLSLLKNVEDEWDSSPLTREEEELLGESLKEFMEYSLESVQCYRDLYPTRADPDMEIADHPLTRLEHLLRCIQFIGSMSAYRHCCPFAKDVKGTVVHALRKGTVRWYEDQIMRIRNPDSRMIRLSQDSLSSVGHSAYSSSESAAENESQHLQHLASTSHNFFQSRPIGGVNSSFLTTSGAGGCSSTTATLTSTTTSASVASSVYEPVAQLNELVNLLNTDLLHILQVYNRLFKDILDIPSLAVVFTEEATLIMNDVSQTFQTTSLPDDVGPLVDHLCQQIIDGCSVEAPPGSFMIDTVIFELFLGLQDFFRYRDDIAALQEKSSKGGSVAAGSAYAAASKQETSYRYYEWFSLAVARWLDIAKFRYMKRIQRSLETDQTVCDDSAVRHSMSTVDVTLCITQMKVFWKNLNWPDPFESYSFAMKLVQVVLYGVRYYSDTIVKRLQDSKQRRGSNNFDDTEKTCVAINDLEHVHRALQSLVQDLDLDSIQTVIDRSQGFVSVDVSGCEPHAYGPIHADIEVASTALSESIVSVITSIVSEVRVEMKNKMFRLAWSPESLPTSEAIEPLLKMLDDNLLALSRLLMKRGFSRVLSVMWNATLEELANQGSDVVKSGDELPRNFHNRLYEALNHLEEFFRVGEAGIPAAELQSERYTLTERILGLNRLPTEILIDKYHEERLADQQRVDVQGPKDYGSLFIRTYFNHDSLTVELIQGKNIIPLDPNGFSDPFVQIELLPRRVFSHCKMQQTQIQKKTLHPVFDECFEFSVNAETCQTQGAMLLFTVMDHDVLTADDFAGEAFYPLSAVPGLAPHTAKPFNFHGLKPVELTLMFAKVDGNLILKTLENRPDDKMAQEFVKRQKARIPS